jgi:hypothetical protein
LQTLQEWDANPNIIWRAAVQHYPMFPLHYDPTDFAAIVNYFLPILMAHKFDLYLCGHEHLLAYISVPYATYNAETFKNSISAKPKHKRRKLEVC